MTKQKPIDIIHERIAQHAATSEGFRPCMAGAHSKYAAALCRRLAQSGQLSVVRVSSIETRYFLIAGYSAPEKNAAKRQTVKDARLAKRPPAMVSAQPSKPASVKAAAIVYPPNYKFTSRPLAPPRNQVVRLPGIYGGMGAL